MGAHAFLSPSSAMRWTRCAGSPWLSQGIHRTSLYADQGTIVHWLASSTQQEDANRNPYRHVGKAYSVVDGEVKPDGDILVTVEMVDGAMVYVDYIDSRTEQGGVPLSETRLHLTPYTEEPDAWGTADGLILFPKEKAIEIVDLKYGMRRVRAYKNLQLSLYMLAALEEYGTLLEIDTVRLTIIQPRVADEPDYWELPLESFLELQAKAITDAAAAVWKAKKNPKEHLTPGEVQCQYCEASAFCPAVQEMATQAAKVQLADIQNMSGESLAEMMKICDVLEPWIKSIRGEVADRLFASVDVPRFKLVEGRRGVRQWDTTAEGNESIIAVTLQHAGVPEGIVFERKLRNPPQLEKLIGKKGEYANPEAWDMVQPLITQAQGKPSVVGEDDPRPAISLIDQFNDLIN